MLHNSVKGFAPSPIGFGKFGSIHPRTGGSDAIFDFMNPDESTVCIER